ncbi:hypothetical protein BV22DRAFT_1059190 [Leucogyrophana mollusca]|uniref:Uncharacterized protein n=1 Tax=Leucogyrophana mollusca TaxID=85980 RepID=A0ACB8BTI4_9AGAM|nr:hypothetical protein BV22DRAFT_1059190 [Leucogyrophana mollusca]
MATSTDALEPVCKGKSKAIVPDPTERTPLLQSGGASGSDFTNNGDNAESSTRHARRSLWSTLTFVFLSSLSICIIVFLFLALLAYSYAARLSDVSPQDIIESALVVEGPDRVDVLNVTENGGIWINIQARVGLDAGSVIGVNTDDDEGTLKDVWKSLGRWGVRRLDRVSIDLTAICICSAHNPDVILASVVSTPFELRVTADPPRDNSWLTSVSIPLLIVPTQNTSDLMQFVRDTWRDGAASVQAHVAKAIVLGGGLDESSWRRKLKFHRQDLQTELSMNIPPLPGLPTPGHNTPFPSFSQLVTLQSFSISSKSDSILLQARASAVDPAPPTFNLTSPALPFIVSLPDHKHSSIPVASVYSSPFTLTHPNITLFVSGTVLPLPSNASSVLSAFVSRYLSLDHNPITIASPLFPSLVIETDFPAPNPKPQVMRNVTIHDMKIKPSGSGNGFLASGTVFARIALPKGMDLSLDVTRVFPDVLVFDGEVPNLPPLPAPREVPRNPLPSPLPERAFGHICPDEWLNATSVRDESSDDEGSAFAVTANLVDIPMEVLPGRQKEFSNFVSKVIFGSQGALAGLQGSAAVGIHVHGLPFHNGDGDNGNMELTGLPFQGSVRIGKKSLLVSNLI